jgi:hypothetical protein
MPDAIVEVGARILAAASRVYRRFNVFRRKDAYYTASFAG